MSQKENLFNSVKVSAPPSNAFDLSHDFKFSMNMGPLYPILCTEVVPGDRFHIGCESMFRMMPMVAPIMHRVDATMHYYFVANRLLWPNFENYITNTPEEEGDPLPAWPTISVDNSNYTDLMDYFGIPFPAVGLDPEVISAMPFAALQFIYDEYYRDQNLIEKVKKSLNGGNSYLQDGAQTGGQTAILTTMRNRAWEHDYFTAALPFAQKGAAVNLPLGTVSLNPDWGALPGSPHFKEANGTLAGDGDIQQAIVGGTQSIVSSAEPADQIAYDPAGSLEVAPTTINDLRRAFKLQEWLEKAARGGSRYSEVIRSFFNVISSDKRLQRPEYITGIKAPVQISEVLNTTGTEDAAQGTMAGHGIGVINGKTGYYRAEEHGYIIGIMSILPKTAYQQGIPKHFLKINDPFELYWPQFAHIGEQPVYNREVYAFQGDNGGNVFGYVPRYAEYKFEQNRVAGQLRNTLDHWHMGRIFSLPPALNQDFVEANPTKRIFAVTAEGEDSIICHVYNKIRAIRPMPKFGTPTY